MQPADCYQIYSQQSQHWEIKSVRSIPASFFFAFCNSFLLCNLVSQLRQSLLVFLDVTVSICT